MKINIFGMGYVGCVSAACLANTGHHVTGIDINETKVSMINEGKSPIVERGFQEAIRRAVSSCRLHASTGVSRPADISMICVGTPSNENGSLQLNQVKKVSEEIGASLREFDSYHVINVRSTVLPSTIEEIVIPIIEDHSQKKVGSDLGICMNPEFMREGSALYDYFNPPFTVVGEFDEKSGDAIARLYEDLDAPLIRTTIKVAEMLKYASNAFHGLKVCFANEIGNLCKKLGIDSHELMDIFCRDVKLNLSPYYLKPGFAFGGSCLPKDLRALLHRMKGLDLNSPVLNAIPSSNQQQIDLAFKLVEKSQKKKVGLLGLSFKPGTDDLRESPMIELVERLIGKGYDVTIYDKEVSLATLVGSNKAYIEETIPHISSLVKESIQDVIENTEVLLVAKNSTEFRETIEGLNGEIIVIDLVRLMSNTVHLDGRYEGICW